jgi:hypothetical protein
MGSPPTAPVTIAPYSPPANLIQAPPPPTIAAVEPPPPPVRDGELTIAALTRFARLFDEISADEEAHYSAAAFVRFVKSECLSGYSAPAGRPGQMVPARRS